MTSKEVHATIMTFEDQEDDISIDMETISTSYGLSPAETRICAMIMEGLSYKEIAGRPVEVSIQSEISRAPFSGQLLQSHVTASFAIWKTPDVLSPAV